MSVSDTPDLKAALDWYGEDWRPFLPPEEQFIGHLSGSGFGKRLNPCSTQTGSGFATTPSSMTRLV